MIKHTILCFVAISVLLSCGNPSPQDMVRKYRREYDITFDFIVGKTNDEVTMSVNVHNQSGGKNLQDLTVLIKAFDQNENVMWEKQETLDLAGLGNYASKEIALKETIPNASEQLSALDIVIAPDNPGSGFENYREFMRIAR